MTESYIFYIFTILAATLSAWISEKIIKVDPETKKQKPNPLFYYLSMGILIFSMGLRSQTAVDDLNYLRGFLEINSFSLFEYYSFRTTEPLFVLLNYFVYYFFKDFQWLLILSSTITIFLFYKALSYEFGKNIFAYSVFIYAVSHYFYFFGIIKLGLATAIVAYSFRYILQNRAKKYIALVLIASLFHYTAIISLLVLAYKVNVSKKIMNFSYLKVTIAVVIVFICLRIISPFLFVKYQGYFATEVTIGYGFVNSIPILLIFLYYRKQITNFNPNNSFYLFLYFISFLIEVFAPIIGIGRMVWYFSLSVCFLWPSIIRVQKNIFMKYLFILIITSYYGIHCYNAYFGESFRSYYMLPYKNILFELDQY